MDARDVAFTGLKSNFVVTDVLIKNPTFER